MDDLTLGNMLTEAYRGQVDYFVQGGVSVSQLSSSVRSDRSGQPDGEMVDRSGQPDECNSSKAQIRTLLEEQRQTIIAEYREKVSHRGGEDAYDFLYLHTETVGDQLVVQGFTDGNEQVTGESGLCAITTGRGKGKGKGGATFQGTRHHCGQFGHKLVNSPEKDVEMQHVRAAKGQK